MKSKLYKLEESRPTNLRGILHDIMPKFEEMISLNYTSNSLVATFRYKDGNAYMVEISPAAFMDKNKIGDAGKFNKKK
jgi:hypothetical protein